MTLAIYLATRLLQFLTPYLFSSLRWILTSLVLSIDWISFLLLWTINRTSLLIGSGLILYNIILWMGQVYFQKEATGEDIFSIPVREAIRFGMIGFPLVFITSYFIPLYFTRLAQFLLVVKIGSLVVDRDRIKNWAGSVQRSWEVLKNPTTVPTTTTTKKQNTSFESDLVRAQFGINRSSRRGEETEGPSIVEVWLDDEEEEEEEEAEAEEEEFKEEFEVESEEMITAAGVSAEYERIKLVSSPFSLFSSLPLLPIKSPTLVNNDDRYL
jgi:hypothetical protein